MKTNEISTEVYQLHVWIRQISPMIWRRIIVRSDSTITDLHIDTLTILYNGNDNYDSVTQNIGLSTLGKNGSTITWLSENTDIISAGGVVKRPVILQSS